MKLLRIKEYKELYQKDLALLKATRGECDKSSIEVKIIRVYRFCSVNRDNFFGKVANKIILKPMAHKTGIDLNRNTRIGEGFIIGHWGRIIINTNAEIGNQFVISPGVVIGADMSGKRKGTPHIGNRVCIHSNAVVVGNIRIGNDVVIAPNAFVNFDVPDHSVVVGNPGQIHHKENATAGFIGVIEK